MTNREIAAALAGSAVAAASTPLIQNVPSWRWVVHTDSLDLYADVPTPPDPAETEGRLILVNCGGALHHARVSLAADGLAVRVNLLPDADRSHVARIAPAADIPVSDEAQSLVRAISQRRDMGEDDGTERPPARALAALVEAAEREGAELTVLDDAALAELAAATLPKHQSPSLPENIVYAVLHGHDESATSWLRAGEALSAVSLEGARRQLTVVPSYTAVDPARARAVLHRVLGPDTTPYVAVRIASANHDN
jgi:hypothetical protein